jgi:retron-type reverse transcriptase
LEAPKLKALLHRPDLYTEFEVLKKNGGKRLVENPKRELKIVQKRLARILGKISPPDYLFCPVKGRSYVTNAACHRHNRVVRCLDIRKYFPSTPSHRVYWFFSVVMKCEPDLANTLTKISTYSGHLPTGSPLSPIMAFFAYYNVWQAIAVIAKLHGLTLTVYIDDVTISGPTVSAAVLWEIKKAIHAVGLRYHKEKCYIDSHAEITGVIVRDGTLLAPNRQLLKLHKANQEFSNPKSFTSRQKLAGKIAGLSGQLDQIRSAK